MIAVIILSLLVALVSTEEGSTEQTREFTDYQTAVRD